jgi:hypothetical protein
VVYLSSKVPHWAEMLDPDPDGINRDPQPWKNSLIQVRYCTTRFVSSQIKTKRYRYRLPVQVYWGFFKVKKNLFKNNWHVKGTVSWEFRPSVFFHQTIPPGPLIHGPFWILLRIRLFVHAVSMTLHSKYYIRKGFRPRTDVFMKKPKI